MVPTKLLHATLPASLYCLYCRWMINTFYSPPVDGAQAVIYAATVPWAQDRKLVAGTPVMPAEDLR